MILAAAGVSVFAFLLMPGAFLGEVFFYGDFHAVFEPLRMALGRALGDGLPLWTDSLSHGQPLLASPFAAALYLPNVLFALSPGDSGRFLTLLTVAHLVWGALGAYLVSRRRGASAAAGFTTAAIYGFGGIALSGSYLSLLCFTSAWLPWLLLAAESVASAALPGAALRRTLVLALTTVFLVSAGDPFVVASALLGTALIVRPAGLAPTRSKAHRLRPVLLVATGLALGLIATLPFLVPAAAYVGVTARGAGLSPALVMERSLHPLTTLALVLPNVFGSVFRLGEEGFLAPGLYDAPTPLFPSYYVGLLTVGLCLRGVATRQRGALRETAWLATQTALALGHFLPLYPLLASLPGLSSTRFPAKWLLPAMLPFALLAARGVDAVAREAIDVRGARRSTLQGLALLLLPATIVLALLFGGDRALSRQLPAAGETTSRSTGLSPGDLVPVVRRHIASGALRTTLPVAAAVLVGILAARRRREQIVAPALALLVATDLASSGRELTRTVPAGLYTLRPRVVDRLEADGAGDGRVWVDESPEARAVATRVPRSFEHVEDVARLQREKLDFLTGASYGLRLAFPADLERLATRQYEEYQRLVETLPARERASLLRAAAVTHVVSPLDRSGAGVVPTGEIPGLLAPPRLYHVERPLPEVRVVAALRVHDGPSHLAKILASSPDDFVDRYAFVERSLFPGARDWILPPGATAGTGDGWHLEIRRKGSVRLDVDVSGPAGFLFVAGTWAPGWRARVDGQDAPLLPVNLAFRGVPIPAGFHRVEIVYSPF